ncbi:HK97 family phage prohead protease [Candidatus Pacearchaeota archaeon]|nr:HK97 family phage prohead protease [Candidatus Pacearchaeota archaeon]
MKEDMERRTYAAELRVSDGKYGDNKPTLKGYAAKFNSLSNPMPIIDEGRQIGTFREQLLPGCFTKALATSDVRALINHDANKVLGRTQSGTLRLVEDEIGLRFDNDPPDTSYATDLQVSMRRGDMTQCSFGFRVADGGDEYVKDPNVENGYIRSISEISKLFDTSIVTFPAYDDTHCAVRTIVGQMKAEEEEAAAAIKEQGEIERRRISNVKKKKLELAERSIMRN